MKELREIPPMTHPLSRHWDQPKREDILIDDHHAVMSQETFDQLHRYDGTYPTGAYEGKMWARQNNGVTWLVWYDVSKDPEKVSIQHAQILILQP